MVLLYIVECNIVQCSAAVEEQEESSRPCVECEVPRELLLHRDQLMPPLEIGFERFEENIWIVQQFWNRSQSIVDTISVLIKHTNNNTDKIEIKF